MNKSIVLGMIVKNEELHIKQTLESIKSIIDYWTIIDTGSTDSTMNLIKETMKGIPGELIQKSWINFGYNRSEVATLTKNKADYTLMLDGDMIVTLNNFNKNDLIADVYDLQINWGIVYYLPLLLSNKYEWKSIGAIHEYWKAEEVKNRVRLNSLTIKHIGKSDRNRENDISILLEELKKEPNNTRYLFYLSRSYLDIKNYEEAIKWSEKRITLGGWNEEIYHSMLNILISKIKLQKSTEEISEYMFKIYYYNSNNAEPLYEVQKYCREKKLFNTGYYIGRIAEIIPMPKNNILFIDKNIYDYKIKDELSIAAYYIAKYQESYDLCNQILQLDNLSESDRNRIKQNKQFCELQLGIKYDLDKFKKETAKEVSKLNYKKYFYQFTEGEKEKFAEDLKNTADFFEDNFNLKIYPVYGTLLGMIRDKDFIAHDTDMDMAYLSNYHTPEEVSQEFRQLCKNLEKYNLLLKNHEPPSHIHIYSPSKQLRFDMWISWIDNNDKYYLTWIFDGEFDKSILLPFTDIIFKTQSFYLMNNYKQFLDFYYGNWTYPLTENWSKRQKKFRLK